MFFAVSFTEFPYQINEHCPCKNISKTKSEFPMTGNHLIHQPLLRYRLPFVFLTISIQPEGTPKWIFVVAMIMAHGNSAVNPILYGMCNAKIRHGYRRVTECRYGTPLAPVSAQHLRTNVAISMRDTWWIWEPMNCGNVSKSAALRVTNTINNDDRSKVSCFQKATPYQTNTIEHVADPWPVRPQTRTDQ